MKKILLLLLSFYAHTVIGQTFEAGYVVLTNGDTLRGQVENTFWEDTPTSIRFRDSAGKVNTYSGNRLNSAYLSSGHLLRRTLLPVDRSAKTDVPHLTNSVQSHQQPDSVLAEVLVTGPATLMSLTIFHVKHFFVRRESRPFLEVTERLYLRTDTNGKVEIVDGNDYKNQLTLYFYDCEAVKKLLQRTPFTAVGMKGIVQTYNQQCSTTQQVGQEIQQIKDTKRVIFRVGVVAGVRYNSLRARIIGYTAQTPTVLDKYNFDNRINPQGGVYADLVSPGRRFALHTALLAARFGSSRAIQLPTLDPMEIASFERYGTLLTLQYGLRAFPPIGPHVQLVLGSGFEINQTLATTSKLTYTDVQRPFLHGFKSNLLPYLEAGVNWNKITLTASARIYEREQYRHYASKSDMRLLQYEVRPWSLNAVVGYRLNNNPDMHN